MKPALSVLSAEMLLIVALGCHNPSANKDLVVLQVETLDAPATVAQGKTLTVGLSVQVGGCLSFDHIQVLRKGAQASLTVWGRDIRSGVTDRGIACPREFLELHEYRLDPPFDSPFTVEVDRGRLSPLTATVQVT